MVVHHADTLHWSHLDTYRIIIIIIIITFQEDDGNTLVFHCAIVADPPPMITWWGVDFVGIRWWLVNWQQMWLSIGGFVLILWVRKDECWCFSWRWHFLNQKVIIRFWFSNIHCSQVYIFNLFNFDFLLFVVYRYHNGVKVQDTLKYQVGRNGNTEKLHCNFTATSSFTHFHLAFMHTIFSTLHSFIQFCFSMHPVRNVSPTQQKYTHVN